MTTTARTRAAEQAGRSEKTARSQKPGRSTEPATKPATSEPSSPIGTPTRVPSGIRIDAEALRSANVEHDTAADSIRSYVLTGRGKMLLSSVGRALADPSYNRAWSVTGPYGTGKSSFGVLLAALLCPTIEHGRAKSRKLDARAAALQLLAENDHALADTYTRAGAAAGFLRAAVTARREPIGATIARAFIEGASRTWADTPPEPVSVALDAMNSLMPGPDAKSVLDVVTACLQVQPILLMVDEFGKSLEHFAAHPGTDTVSDLFLMQELAELASGTRGKRNHPLFLVTFQHLSFADYANRAASLQRREWAKVQGRFIDVSFADDAGDVSALLAGGLDHSRLDTADVAALAEYGQLAARSWKDHGLASVLAAESDAMSCTYPVHPLAVASLAALCATLGQHDRTLTGLLTAEEPFTVARFLRDAAGAETGVPSTPGPSSATALATYKLADVFDYFASSVRSPALSSSQGSRWLEIEARINSAQDLPPHELATLKTIALLNLTDTGGALRASADNVAFALSDPQFYGDSTRSRCLETLGRLVELGFLTYREHADEYRLWAGTDIDIKARAQAARDLLNNSDIGELLARSYVPAAVVAGKHSQSTGMLRHFVTVVCDTSKPVEPAPFPGPADGTLVLHLGTAEDTPTVSSPLPVLIGTTTDAGEIREAARDVLALDEVLHAEDLDPVARSEVRERAAIARARLTALLARAYNPSRSDVSWTLQLPDGSPVQVEGQRSLSALVSLACDRAFPDSPHVRNEMLGRHQLTSQGAKARRELITALLTKPGEELAGLSGYGPDVAMYKGVVEWLGLHGSLDGDGNQGWKAPRPDSPGRAYAAYREIGRMVREAEVDADHVTIAHVARRLAAPPYGVKAGVFPLMLVAALAYSEDDIAVFEDGSFVARLSPDFVERIIRTPERARLLFAPPGPGQREAVIGELGTSLGVDPHQRHRHGPRNPSLVRVAAALLDQIRSASSYALSTASLGPVAISVRKILRTAQNPDELLFDLLPEAVGEKPIPPGTPTETRSMRRYVTKLLTALTELAETDQRLAEQVGQWCAQALHTGGGVTEARAKLKEYADGIQTGVTEPLVRSLLAHAQEEFLPEDDWLAQLALIVTDDPMATWRDDHPQRFKLRFGEATAAISRLYALHFNSNSDDSDDESARRLTLTRRDGREEHLIVTLPAPEVADTVNAKADSLLRDADAEYGAGGRQMLVASLVARLLGDADEQPANDDLAARRSEHKQGATS